MNGFFQEINGMLDRFLTPAVKIILVLNVLICFVLVILYAVSPGATSWLLMAFGQTPGLSVLRGMIWQFLTFNFVHLQFGHLLFNMLALFFFGPTLENKLGTRRFWIFYLVTGVGAGVFHALITLSLGRPEATIIGASGAIYGVLLAFAAYYPEAPIYLFGIYPIKAKYLMILMIFLTFMGSAGSAGGNVSHLTHLTGLLTAYGYLAWVHREWDIRRWRWLG